MKLQKQQKIEKIILKNKAIEERLKLNESLVNEKEKSKKNLDLNRKFSVENHEDKVHKVLKKKHEIENQKYWEDYQRVFFKRKKYFFLK